LYLSSFASYLIFSVSGPSGDDIGTSYSPTKINIRHDESRTYFKEEESGRLFCQSTEAPPVGPLVLVDLTDDPREVDGGGNSSRSTLYDSKTPWGDTDDEESEAPLVGPPALVDLTDDPREVDDGGNSSRCTPFPDTDTEETKVTPCQLFQPPVRDESLIIDLTGEEDRAVTTQYKIEVTDDGVVARPRALALFKGRVDNDIIDLTTEPPMKRKK
jgi:hypothetical protein